MTPEERAFLAEVLEGCEPQPITPEEQIRIWREDPVTFVRENFGVEPDAWQAATLRAFADPSKPLISMQACAGPGKSAALAWCGLNFISCYGEPDDHPKGFCASVTSNNLYANLWPEYAKWMQRSDYLSSRFEWTGERIFAKEEKATWFLEARSWPKTASAEEMGKTLSGLHGGYVLAQLDESGSIPMAVSRAAQQILSTNPKFGKVMQAGNPLSRDGMLYGASADSSWHVVRITGDPDDPLRSPRIDIKWAREQIKKYGRDNPWVMAYILGLFPPGGLNALLDPDTVRAAMQRELEASDYEWGARIIGVDVAREGDDRSVIVRRQGLRMFDPVILRNADSLQGAGQVAAIARDWHADAIFVDNTGGFGAGWIDQLRVLGHTATGVHFAGHPIDMRYANKRAEMWLLMSEWVKQGAWLANVPELVDELCVPTYGFKGDKLMLEDKDSLKEAHRLGRSPDIADALGLTFAYPVVARPVAGLVPAALGERLGQPGVLWDGSQQRYVRVRDEQPPSHNEFGFTP